MPSSDSDTAEDTGNGQFSMMDMLMNMLTPEQKTMYEMFGLQNADKKD